MNGQSEHVSKVDAPYLETDIAYIVMAINPEAEDFNR
ncbi:MAG: hypothetical protein ACI9LY_000100 [Arenicella sp.]|jgi:hypothetical protein